MKTKVTLLGLQAGKLEEAKIHDNFVDLAMPVVSLSCLDVLQDSNMDI